jgi:hypothetical protein
MSKVTEELDFMWERRLLEYYHEMRELHDYEGIETMEHILKHLGLTVKGIEG